MEALQPSPISLEIQQLSFVKNHKNILRDISLSFDAEPCVGILGANGAGKSSLFKCIMGLEMPTSGDILLNGSSLLKRSMAQRRTQGLGYLAQEHWLFHDVDVLGNLMMMAELMGMPKEGCKERCRQFLRRLGLHDQEQQMVSRLSGGEKRRLELARVCLEEAQIIILDEPFAGLDPKAIRELKNALGSLRAEGVQVVISDHQVEHVLDLCDQVHLLHGGVLQLSCASSQLKDRIEAQRWYL